MKTLTRWPVTVSYYDRDAKTKEGEQTPVYAMSFELFENGVSRALVLDYNDFVIAGAMGRFDVRIPSRVSDRRKPARTSLAESAGPGYASAPSCTSGGTIMSKLEHIRPSGLHHNPAYSHVVVASGARTIYIRDRCPPTMRDGWSARVIWPRRRHR